MTQPIQPNSVKIQIDNLLTNETTKMAVNTEAQAELELRRRFAPALTDVPVGNLEDVVDKLNGISYLQVTVEL